ncbi:DUF4397 domain-containing protein [Roseateles sp. SL47]|jgi:Domain of unknown function (DUF4397)|uniref:DUF4397 domain-containing protein n=1 Tax=Roseateles sp. SL47 TaxID=2995138 RepID=UPI0022718B35|nr:DUF4397 domain-containing protein [Roseateles sp. SL47]WAC74048.1 DUF4397 domain-containing protein [Roseateles sp. SL47]
MRIKTWAWGLSVASMALLTACGGGGSSSADVRLLNASISYSSLDMAVGEDETVVNSAITYANVGSYASVKTDDAGTYIQNSTVGSTLYSTTPSLSSGTKYTMIAYGTTGAVKTTLLQENQDDPDSGKSKFLILNLAPDAGALDIYETSTSETTLSDAATVASNIAAGSGSGYASLKSGTYRFVVTAAGDKTDIRLEIPSLTLPDAGVSALILTGSNGGVLVNGMQLIQKGAVTNYANSTARVRLVSGLPTGNAITGSVGSNALLSNASSPAIGSYVKVASGSQAVALSVNGTAIASNNATIQAGYDYTMLVYGSTSAPTVTMLSDDNKLPTTSTYAKVRLINGLSNSTAGLNLNINYAAYASNVTAGASSTAQQIAAVTDALLTVTTTSTTLFTQTDTDIIANNVYTVFVLGDGSGQVSASLRRER